MSKFAVPERVDRALAGRGLLLRLLVLVRQQVHLTVWGRAERASVLEITGLEDL